jgi:hydroxymethylglutaryl-CoA synthase
MPRNAWAMAYLAALAHDASAGDVEAGHELEAYCGAAGASPEELSRELRGGTAACPDGGLPADAFPVATAVLKAFRKSDAYPRIVEDKLRFGTAAMMELGNLYTAALPAWLAAGLDDAAAQGADFEGRDLLVLGYGSGDAAEAIPARVAPGWREAAAAIGFREALAAARDLDHAEYALLHDAGTLNGAAVQAPSGVVIDHVGESNDPAFQDFGIAYYKYCGRP